MKAYEDTWIRREEVKPSDGACVILKLTLTDAQSTTASLLPLVLLLLVSMLREPYVFELF